MAEVQSPEQVIATLLTLEVEMQNSGDSTRYREFTARCRACQEVADVIDGYYAAGGFVEIASQQFLGANLLQSDGTTSAYEVSVDPEPTTYAVSEGSDEVRLPGDPLKFKVTLVKRAEAWQVEDYAQLAS